VIQGFEKCRAVQALDIRVNLVRSEQLLKIALHGKTVLCSPNELWRNGFSQVAGRFRLSGNIRTPVIV